MRRAVSSLRRHLFFVGDANTSKIVNTSWSECVCVCKILYIILFLFKRNTHGKKTHMAKKTTTYIRTLGYIHRLFDKWSSRLSCPIGVVWLWRHWNEAKTVLKVCPWRVVCFRECVFVHAYVCVVMSYEVTNQMASLYSWRWKKMMSLTKTKLKLEHQHAHAHTLIIFHNSDRQ